MHPLILTAALLPIVGCSSLLPAAGGGPDPSGSRPVADGRGTTESRHAAPARHRIAADGSALADQGRHRAVHPESLRPSTDAYGLRFGF